jgi:hypothetical protein
MGRHRNSSYACYTVLFANGQLIAINIDSQRLPSTPFRRFGSARPVDAVLRQIHRQTLASGASFSTSFGHRQQAGVVRAAWPACHARKLACRAAVRRETKAFIWRLEAVRPKKSVGAVQSKFSPSKSKRYCGKINRYGNIAAELPCRLLTFTKHLSTCGVAQGAIDRRSPRPDAEPPIDCAGVCDAQAKTRNISTGCFSGEYRQI